jgi:cytidylate kinase
MICVLHGPGGSGKSTVVNVVQAHGKLYCESLGHPYAHRTIVVTAMSGVAATLLHGETAHRALGLMKTSSKFTKMSLTNGQTHDS